MKTISIFCLMLMAWAADAQSAVQAMFQQYSNDKNFTSVYISEHLFALLGDVPTDGNAEDQTILELAAGLKELTVLSTEKDAMTYYEEAQKKINTIGFKQLMNVRDEGENVQILMKEEGKKISELLVLVGSADEFILVSLLGDIDLKKIMGLAKQADIKGLNHLEKIEDK